MAGVNAKPFSDTATVTEVLDRVRSLAAKAMAHPLHLACVPPLGKDPYPYGDQVPLGFVLLALSTAAATLNSPGLAAEAENVRRYLLARRTRGLWAYQTGGLETSIDSGLVLLGIREPLALEELERFSDGNGSYLPQLHTKLVEPGKMTVRDSLLHWCQPDFSIACLIRALRRRHGLPEVTPLGLLEAGFETRSGLYLANPYFTDWLLAMAIQDDPNAASLADRLRNEISCGASADGLFGKFDTLLSTALAILALQSLSTGSIEIHVQALVQLVNTGSGLPSTPFYSTEKIPWSNSDPWTLIYLITTGGARQLIRSRGQEHTITFYRDTHGLVVYSLVLLALLGKAGTQEAAADPHSPHSRYCCDGPEHYIAGFALPPYLVEEGAA